MVKNNIERLTIIAKGMAELNQKIVFVGGAVVQLYASDNSHMESRATEDVDCIIRYQSHLEKISFEKALRKHHFYEDTNDGVICRWMHNGEKVDIMPTDEKYLSFTNKWYDYGYENRITYTLPEGNTIFILPVTAFIATKFEALHSRGGNDLRCAHDFEDIIFVLNNCSEFDEFCNKEPNEELKSYIKEQSIWLLSRPFIEEEIECVLPYGEEDRSSYILKILTSIKGQ